MQCCCFLPGCQACFNSSVPDQGALGHTKPKRGKRQVVAAQCGCFQSDCDVCASSFLVGSFDDSMSEVSAVQDDHRMLQEDKRSTLHCSCFMPDCAACFSAMPMAADSAGAQPATLKRRKRTYVQDGREKRSLQEDVREDQAKQLDMKTEHAQILQRIPSSLQPSALAALGRSADQRMLFLEVFAGCAALTKAVMKQSSPSLVGPAVDIKKIEGDGVQRLSLDLTQSSDQNFLLLVVAEGKPEWLHIASECTLWTPMSRLTGRKTPTRWRKVLDEAKEQHGFSMHLALLQHEADRWASWEQPPRCASWPFQRTQFLLQQGFMQFRFPSCAYGMVDLDNGKPIQKLQAIMCNNQKLQSLERKCTCPGARKERHSHLQGAFKGNHPFFGWRKTTWSGRYPMDLCTAFATIVVTS